MASGMLGFTGSVGGELGDNFNEIPTYRNPDGSINLESLLQYLRSRSSDLEEIMAAGTPGEYELTIGGPDRDSPLAQVYASIIGRANEVPPEVLADETGRQVFINEEFGRVFREIAEAGSWEAWAEANEIDIEGPPEEPPTDIEEEEPEAPEQQTISLEDFQEIYSSNPEDDNYLDPAEYMEDGTYTDPETGIVYVINIPPPVETEEEEGGGGEEAPTEEEGEPTTDQPEEEEVIVDPTDSTVDDEDAETADTIPPDTTEEPDVGAETGIPDFYTVREDGTVVTILDPDTPLEPSQIPPWVDTETPGTYPESGPKPDEEVAEEEPELDLPTEESDIIFDPRQTPDFPGGDAPIPEQEPEESAEEEVPAEEVPETSEQPGTETPSDTPTTGTDDTGTEGDGTGTGTGTGTGEGEGEGDGTGKKRDGLFNDYKDFKYSIGYQPVQLQQLIAPPKKDYLRELDSLIVSNLQKRKKGMFDL